MERPSPGDDREVLIDDGDGDDQPGRDVIIMFAVFFEGGLAPISLVLGWWLGHNPLARFAWEYLDALWGALAVIPPILLFLIILRWPLGPLERIRSFCVDEFIPLLAGSSWSDMALIALSAGVGEEMLFRGVLQTSMAGWLGVVWGLIVSSAAVWTSPSDLGPLHRADGPGGLLPGRRVLDHREPAQCDGDSRGLRFRVDGLPAQNRLQGGTDPVDSHRRCQRRYR